MAKTIEEQLAESVEKMKQLQDERAAYVAENENLRKIVGTSAGTVIKGKVSLTVKTTDGKPSTKSVGIKSGHVKTHVLMPENDWNGVVDSAALLAHANGEMTAEQKGENPLLASMSSDDAKAYVEHLVKIGYAGLDIVEVK